jgi:hypothetical protein
MKQSGRACRLGCGLLLLCAFARQPALLDRLVGEDHGRPLTLYLSSDSDFLSHSVFRATSAARVAVGFEQAAAPPPRQPSRSDAPVTAVVVTGKSVEYALGQVFGAAGGYRWLEANGVIEITPPVSGAFLEQIVPEFTLTNATLMDALAAVHRLMDPAYAAPTGIVGSMLGNADDPAEQARWSRPTTARFSVRVRHVTVRQVLDAIAVAFDGASWLVRYTGETPAYATCEISFETFDGVRIGQSARIGR